jgi:hypothetical protein
MDDVSLNGTSLWPSGRTRAERRIPLPVVRVLVLKLDHLGDFIMGLPAMERLRGHFPSAHLTLVCGSWNVAMAQGLGLFDAVVAFDVFTPDAAADEASNQDRLMLKLRETIKGFHDLAIDLRVDDDTRPYLTAVAASFRAGIGTGSRFAFLDVFLPIDATRPQPPPPRILAAHQFQRGPDCTDQGYAIGFTGGTPPPVLVFGPYLQLPLGRYHFRPFLECAEGSAGYDIVIDDAVVRQGELATDTPIAFFNPTPAGHWQFRLTAPAPGQACRFRFFGGELTREPVSDGLHHCEYLVLLVELIALRVKSGGLLTEQAVHRCGM